MYPTIKTQVISLENFALGKLEPNNRWVLMAEIIPWSEFEEEYSSQLSDKMGAPGKPCLMALASLIIKEKLVPAQAGIGNKRP